MAIRQPYRIFPKQASVSRNQKNKRITLPPPVGGWNARDEPTNMGPQDAGDLINLIPRPGFVEMRGGYESYSTGVGAGDVDLCTEFYNGATRQLITASATNIYNSTATGAAVSLGTGFTNGRWDTAIMNGVMGMVNGADAPQTWDGTTLAAMTLTGPTATNVIGLNIFKGRSYFWEDDSQSFWYSNTLTLGGTTAEFALGEIADEGGRLMRMINWTVDGGAGPDDYAVFIMDSGEVIVYQGDDPGTASSWGLVGKYKIAEPLNDRAMTRLSGNVLLVTENDIVTLPDAFSKVTPPPSKISSAVADAARSFGMNDGWQVTLYPNARLLIINVPVSLSPDSFEQYVLELQTGNFCRFTDIPARAWGVYNGQAFFGSTDGTVYRFDTVNADVGNDIRCEAQMAWTNFGLSENKQVPSVQPVFEASGALNYSVAAGFDFGEPTVATPSSTGSGGTPWGSSWGSPWSTNPSIQKGWNMLLGNGEHFGLRLGFSRSGDRPRWLRTNYLIQRGGNL